MQSQNIRDMMHYTIQKSLLIRKVQLLMMQKIMLDISIMGCS